MTIYQPILTNDQVIEITKYINNYRAKNQAPPLIWDDTILSFSNHWSYYLLNNNLFLHSGNPSYGENLAYFEGYGTDPMILLKKAVDSWYNEITSYNFASPGFYETTGHFTCLVWLASTNFAIGISIDDTTSAADIVFNTSPPGNVEGAFQKNVLPVKNIIQPPLPVPLPLPVPAPAPVPTSSYQIDTIINELNNISYSINTKQPRYFLTISINKVITDIKSLNMVLIPSSITISIITMLYGIIKLLRNNKNNMYIINTINNIIDQLKMYK